MDLSRHKALYLWRARQPVRWLSLLLGPLLLIPLSGLQPAGLSQTPGKQPVNATRNQAADLQAIDTFISREMKRQRIPGLALAITRDDQVVYVQGYGTDGHGRPVTPQTQFLIASVSKAFTAMAVMQLVEAGQVELDAPIQTYLLEFALDDPNGAAHITIRQLLNQTSGLSDNGFPEILLPQPQSLEERMESLREARPVAAPGTEYHYFNPNYQILARVVEVVSGQPFAEYVENRIFASLAMNSTLTVARSSEGNQATDRLAKGHLFVFGFPFAYPEPEGFLQGSGGMISSAEDMAHALIAQVNGGRYQGQQVVSAKSMETMHTPPSGVNSDYAMGWMESRQHGMRTLEHTGVISTYSADVVLIPEQKTGILLLYNISSLPTNAIGSPAIKNGLISLLQGEPVESGPVSVGLWGWFTAALTLVGGFLAVRSLLDLPRWAERARVTPTWRLLPGILWTFAPGLLLLGMPALTARFADRVFGFVNLYKSMLGIFAWLGLTGVLGAINGLGRISVLLRRATRPGHPRESNPK